MLFLCFCLDSSIPLIHRCQVLQSVIAAGDAPFVLELRGSEKQLLGFLPTKASLIQHSLASAGVGSDIQYTGPLPHIRRKSQFASWFQWIKLAGLYCAGCWGLLLAPELLLRYAPSILKTTRSASLADVLPLCPSTLSQAFQLGAIRERVSSLLAMPAPDPELVQSALREAESVVGKTAGTVTTQHVLDVMGEITKLEAAESLATRMGGFFSFVNTMWLLAIIGIAISIGPSLYHLLVPLRRLLARVWRWLLNNVIVPVAKRLHRWGVFPFLIYHPLIGRPLKIVHVYQQAWRLRLIL